MVVDGGGGGGELFVGGGEEEGGRAWWEDKGGAGGSEGEALRGVGRGGASESELGLRRRWRFGGRERVDLEVVSWSQGRVRAIFAGCRGYLGSVANEVVSLERGGWSATMRRCPTLA